MWIDEIAHSALPHTEAGDIVFETSAEAIEAVSTLFGKPLIRDLPVTEADARAFIALVKSGSPEDVLRQFLALLSRRERPHVNFSVCQGKASSARRIRRQPGARGARCRRRGQLPGFQVAGAGDLIGVGNGNPHNVDSFSRPRHSTWHGQALAILWPGGLMLTASADGLRPARLTLGVKPGRD